MKRLTKWLREFTTPLPPMNNRTGDTVELVVVPDQSTILENSYPDEGEVELTDMDDGISEVDQLISYRGLKPIVDVSKTGCLQNEAMLYDED